MQIPFVFVDVFAERPLEGNPLAVIPDAGDLSVETMRKLAAEFHQAETTFIVPPRVPGADWSLRSFTVTGVEVGCAGHNSLGAWWWLAEADRVGARQPGWSELTQEIGYEQLPVFIQRDEAGGLLAVALAQNPPTFGSPWTDRSRLGEVLGIGEGGLRPPCFPGRFPRA